MGRHVILSRGDGANVRKKCQICPANGKRGAKRQLNGAKTDKKTFGMPLVESRLRKTEATSSKKPKRQVRKTEATNK
jgi:hypothetical protein